MIKKQENIKEIIQNTISEFFNEPYKVERYYDSIEYYSAYKVHGFLQHYDRIERIIVFIKKEDCSFLCWSSENSFHLINKYICDIQFNEVVSINDSSYDRELSCMHTIHNIKPGTWKAYKFVSANNVWDNRLCVSEFRHQNMPQNGELEWSKQCELNVDNRTISVIDDIYYRGTNDTDENFNYAETRKNNIDIIEDHLGVYHYEDKKIGLLCASNIINKKYPLEIVEKDGEIVAIRITFI